MSVYTITSSFYTIKPRIWIEKNTLYAEIPFFIRLLSLFSFFKIVAVNRNGRFVMIQTRMLWVISKIKTIPFDRIERIDYSFESTATNWNLFAGRTDQYETFTVSLCLREPYEKVRLFSFSGEGAVETGWTGVILGDEIFDYSGDQESSSRHYVELLMKFTGKTLT